MGKYREYTPDFKAQAVGLALERGNVGRTAKDLGIPNTTLRKWIEAYQKDNKDAGLTLNPTDAMYVRQLEKDNARLRQENEFLKKAAAFFAKTLVP